MGWSLVNILYFEKDKAKTKLLYSVCTGEVRSFLSSHSRWSPVLLYSPSPVADRNANLADPQLQSDYEAIDWTLFVWWKNVYQVILFPIIFAAGK